MSWSDRSYRFPSLCNPSRGAEIAVLLIRDCASLQDALCHLRQLVSQVLGQLHQLMHDLCPTRYGL